MVYLNTLTLSEDDHLTETVTEIMHSSVLGQLLVPKETLLGGSNKQYRSAMS